MNIKNKYIFIVATLFITFIGIFMLLHPKRGLNIVAGGAAEYHDDDNGYAVKTSLSSPASLCYGPNGYLYINDLGNQAIRQVGSDNMISTILRISQQGVNIRGKRYIGEKILSVEGIYVDKNSILYFSDVEAGKIFKIIGNRIVKVAGSGRTGFSGDRGAAVYASLNNPTGIAMNRNEELFIADSGNNRIRKVDVNGIITTVAGTNRRGKQGDGGPALKAELDFPNQIVIDSDGVIYIGEKDGIRKIDQNGIISTLNQGGKMVQIALDSDDNFYAVNCLENNIVKTTKQGKVVAEYILPRPSTIYPPKRGDASKMQFVFITGIAVDTKGYIYLSDSQLCAVFRLNGI